MRISLNYHSARPLPTPTDPLTGLLDATICDTEPTLFGTSSRPLKPGGVRTVFRGIESARGRDRAFFSLVGDVPDGIEGHARTPAEALNSGQTSQTIPSDGFLSRKPSQGHKARDEGDKLPPDLLARRMIADDTVVCIKPLDRTMEAAITRLRQKLYGTAADDFSHLTIAELKDKEDHNERDRVLAQAALDEMALSGKVLETRVTGTMEAALLPYGLNAVLAGADNFFELENLRFDVHLSRTDQWLDERRPMQFDTTYNVPVRIVPCKVRTGRFCRPSFASIDCFAEGRFSTFTGFGPGIAAYFKLLKGIAGVFIFITVAALGPLGWLSLQGTFTGPPSIAFPLSLGSLGAYHTSPAHLVGSWKPPQVQWFLTIINIVVAIALYNALVWFREVEASDTELTESSAVTVDRFTVELDWLPQEMDAPAVADWIAKQILTAEEAVEGKPVRVVVALELAPYLITSKDRHAVATRIEVIECRLAALFVKSRLASVFDDAYVARITAKQKSLLAERGFAVKAATAKLRAALRESIAISGKCDDFSEEALHICNLEIEAAERSKAHALAMPVDNEEIVRFLSAGGRSLTGGLNATRISESELAHYTGTDAGLVARAKGLFSLRRKLLAKAHHLGVKMDALLKVPRVIKAWVTFNTATMAESVRERLAFSVVDSVTCYSSVPRWRRMAGTRVVRARVAPKPSAIQWADLTSNHYTTHGLHCGASALLTVVCVGTLFVAFFGQVVSTYLRSIGVAAAAAHAACAIVLWAYENAGGRLVACAARHCERFDTRDSREAAVLYRLTLVYTMKWAALVIVFATAGDTLRSGLAGGDLFAALAPAASLLTPIGNGTWTDPASLAGWREGAGKLWTPGGLEAATHALIMREWYADVAPVLVVGGLLGVVGMLWVPVAEALRVNSVRCRVQRCGVKYPSQLSLNRALAPPQLHMDATLAALLAQCGIALLSGVGAPLLYALAALAAVAAYWAELFAFADLYAKPAYRSEHVPRAAVDLLNIYLVLACLASMFYICGPKILSVIIYLKNSSKVQYSDLSTLSGGDTIQLLLLNFILAFLAIAMLLDAQLRRLIKFVLCWKETTVCFSKHLFKWLMPPALRAKVLTIREAEEALALDHLRENYKDAQRRSFLLDAPSYDVRENVDFASSFGTRMTPRVYEDEITPLPLPPGYQMEPVGEFDPVNEAALLSFVTASNSLSLVKSLVPSETVRANMYGTNLEDTEAVIVNPRIKPAVGEGRIGFAFMRSSRVQYSDTVETARQEKQPEGARVRRLARASSPRAPAPIPSLLPKSSILKGERSELPGGINSP